MTLEQLAMPKRVYDRAYASVRFRADKLDPLKVPPDFDLAAFWQQSTITFKSTLPKYVAKFRVSPDVFPRLSFAGRFARVGDVLETDAHGWLVVTVRFDVEEMACEYALSFGSSLEVLEPRSLREKVIEAAQQVVRFYLNRG